MKHSQNKMQEGVWLHEGFAGNVWGAHIQVGYGGHPKWIPIKALSQHEHSYL